MRPPPAAACRRCCWSCPGSFLAVDDGVRGRPARSARRASAAARHPTAVPPSWPAARSSSLPVRPSWPAARPSWPGPAAAFLAGRRSRGLGGLQPPLARLPPRLASPSSSASASAVSPSSASSSSASSPLGLLLLVLLVLVGVVLVGRRPRALPPRPPRPRRRRPRRRRLVGSSSSSSSSSSSASASAVSSSGSSSSAVGVLVLGGGVLVLRGTLLGRRLPCPSSCGRPGSSPCCRHRGGAPPSAHRRRRRSRSPARPPLGAVGRAPWCAAASAEVSAPIWFSNVAPATRRPASRAGPRSWVSNCCASGVWAAESSPSRSMRLGVLGAGHPHGEADRRPGPSSSGPARSRPGPRPRVSASTDRHGVLVHSAFLLVARDNPGRMVRSLSAPVPTVLLGPLPAHHPHRDGGAGSGPGGQVVEEAVDRQRADVLDAARPPRPSCIRATAASASSRRSRRSR